MPGRRPARRDRRRRRCRTRTSTPSWPSSRPRSSRARRRTPGRRPRPSRSRRDAALPAHGRGRRAASCFLHGFGGDLEQLAVQRCRRCRPTRTPSIALDLPGHGGSTKEWRRRPRRRAVEQFLDAHGVEPRAPRRALDGRPRGRASSPLRSPERVLSLTLIAARRPGRGDQRRLHRRVRRRREPARAQAGARAAVRRPGAGHPARWSTTCSSTSASTACRRRCETLRDGLLAGARIDLDELSVPVLVIWGAQDRVISQPSGEVHVIERAGHSPHLESAAEVNDLIREFVRLAALVRWAARRPPPRCGRRCGRGNSDRVTLHDRAVVV